MASIKDLKVYDRFMVKRTKKRFWIGIVRVDNGVVVETHKYEEAYRNDFQPDFYFTPESTMLVANGLAIYFWAEIHDGKLSADAPMSPALVKKIREQIVNVK